MNRIIIADIIARAGAATVIPGTVPDPDGGRLLHLQRCWRAWSSRGGPALPLPHGVELHHRGYAPALGPAADARGHQPPLRLERAATSPTRYIASWFATRGVRVQFVRGWQDGLITGGALNPAFPGGDAATPFMTALPSTVSFLAYPAGSVAVARQDVVTLTNVYDAACARTERVHLAVRGRGLRPDLPVPRPASLHGHRLRRRCHRRPHDQLHRDPAVTPPDRAPAALVPGAAPIP